mmetsp:Transcript_9203/g.22482  ORF Transcript_9203/g.22482 Transcript_9203/m.22482 type:complete len:520 (+) Transcript_9203:47-1606(+)
MRVSTAVISLGLYGSNVLDSVVEAVKCGTPLTTECLSDSDVRFDADYTKDLKGQDPRWINFEGYWKIELVAVDMEGNEVPPNNKYNPNGSGHLPYPYGRFMGFYNHTFLGSRFIASRYYIHKPSPQDFCDQPIEPPYMNVVGDGTCGVNGHAHSSGFYATSSHENDGHMNEIRAVGGYSIFRDTAPMDHPDMPSRYQVLDSGTVNNFLQMPGVMVQDSSYTFMDKDRVMLTNTAIDLFNDGDDASGEVFMGKMTRLTKEEFVKGIEDAYEEANVLPSERMPIPYASQFYPTEEEWCNTFQDPSCSVSPYQEPVASLNGGGIALIVVLCVAFLSAAFCLFYRHAKATQKKRIKEHLIDAMARNIVIAPAAGQLSPSELKREFDRVDKDKGGTVSKDELWEYICSGHVGTMSNKDFNAMWSIIDLDGSGEVDFVEFITFLSSCGDQFEKVHKEQGHKKREDLIEYASQALSSRRLMASINQDEDKGEEGQAKRTVRLGDIKESEDEAKAAVDKGKQADDDV